MRDGDESGDRRLIGPVSGELERRRRAGHPLPRPTLGDRVLYRPLRPRSLVIATVVLVTLVAIS